MEAQQRADPVWTVAEIVATAALDDAVGVGLAPQPLVDAERNGDTGLKIAHILDRIDAHRRLYEIEIELRVPAIEETDSLRHRPGLVDVDADHSRGADPVAQRFEHRLLACLIDPRLDVIDGISARAPVARLA